MKSIKYPVDHNIPFLSGTPVRIGIFGCSDIARRKFIPALHNCRGAELAAVAGSSPDKTADFARAYSCRAMTASELLASPEAELLYLSLPNHLHEEWAIKALEAGKHLICEKPLSTSLASAKKILDCAARNNRLIYENQMFLFHPQHATVKALITAGRIGTVKALRVFFGFPLPPQGNFRLDPHHGGGAFHDLARYPLGIAVHLLQGALSRFSGHSLWHNDLNIGVTATAVTDKDETLIFSLNFGQQYESLYEVVGDAGKIRLERAFTTPAELSNTIFLTEGSALNEIPVPPADHFQRMIEHIASIIRSGADFSLLNRRAGLIAQLADNMERCCLRNDDEKN